MPTPPPLGWRDFFRPWRNLRQKNTEQGALARTTDQRNHSTENPCYRIVANVKPKPAAAAPQSGGKKRVKNTRLILRPDTATIIANPQLNKTIIVGAGADSDTTVITTGKTMQDGIIDQIG